MSKLVWLILFLAVVSTVFIFLFILKLGTTELVIKVDKHLWVSYTEELLVAKVYVYTTDGSRIGNILMNLSLGDETLSSWKFNINSAVYIHTFNISYREDLSLIISWRERRYSFQLKVKDEERVIVEGEHIILDLKKRSFDLFNNVLDWLRKLDLAYEAYQELVGTVPYGGEKIVIKEVDEYPGGWAVAGNPVKWYSKYVPDAIKQINEGDWLFGILHELGHDFDIDYRWVWNAESSANFKMVYVAEKLKAKIKQGGVWYDYSVSSGKTLDDYYAMMAARTGEEKRLKQWPNFKNNDAETHKLLIIKNMIGWEPFKKTYRAWLNLTQDEIPKDPVDKFNLFLYYLCKFSGRDLTQYFIEWGFPVKDDTIIKVREELKKG